MTSDRVEVEGGVAQNAKVNIVVTVSKGPFTCKLRTHDDNVLLNQNPVQITAALDYYAKKIMRDDGEIDLAVRKKGLAGLYRYNRNALMTAPEFANNGKKLLRIAIGYEKWFNIFLDWYGCLINFSYYRALNILYTTCAKRRIF